MLYCRQAWGAHAAPAAAQALAGLQFGFAELKSRPNVPSALQNMRGGFAAAGGRAGNRVYFKSKQCKKSTSEIRRAQTVDKSTRTTMLFFQKQENEKA